MCNFLLSLGLNFKCLLYYVRRALGEPASLTEPISDSNVNGRGLTTSNMSKEKLTYVITGGCGFLGQHLLRVLLEKEENIQEIRLFDKHICPDLQSHSTGKRNN